MHGKVWSNGLTGSLINLSYLLCSQLLFSFSFLLPEIKQGHLSSPGPKTVLAFSVPAFLYCVNNNLVVHIQLYLDPASFQVRDVPNPGGPLTNFNDGVIRQRFIFYTQKNHSFRICLPKKITNFLAYPKKIP